MGFLKGIFLFFLVLGIATIGLTYFWLYLYDNEPDIPKIHGLWWGKGPKNNYKEDESLRKFTVNISDKVLKDLNDKLKASIYPSPLEDVEFEYGFNTKYLRTVVDYWQNKYDWRKQEAAINTFNHFKTQIDGIDIHYMHIKPKAVPSGFKVLPLIMVHGWPGSFVEFLGIIPYLTQPNPDLKLVFEVICPSIPGYGFSDPAQRKGMGGAETAYTFNKLMHRLGFRKYYAQGGDWGALIVTNMAILYPDSVIGVHCNMAFADNPRTTFLWFLGAIFPQLVVDSKDYNKLYPLKEKLMFLLRESGYMHIQGTKPDTVGVALANSPVGLAAYILEKFATWTIPEGRTQPGARLTEKFTFDQLLTNVMIYYVTGSITSSARYYKENFDGSQDHYKLDQISVKVPSGLAAFPNEIINLPESLVQIKYRNLISYTDMPRGGHFAAMEEPELLAKDVWQFVGKVERLPKTEKH